MIFHERESVFLNYLIFELKENDIDFSFGEIKRGIDPDKFNIVDNDVRAVSAVIRLMEQRRKPCTLKIGMIEHHGSNVYLLIKIEEK
ncbi:hypothetical protein POP12_127 [Pectobacterium phage POP12]|nr:hypothetical protein POP12_127 [Pectobacterium phage POP12]